MLFGFYICVIFTNWGNSKIVDRDHWDYSPNSQGPMIIKLVICFGTVLLYGWTLIAPKVLGDRDFDEQ